MINSTIATTAFNQAGLDAMGPASGQLAALWAEGDATYDQSAMTLNIASAGTRWHAMVGGTLQWRKFGAPELTDAAGQSLTGVVAVLRFHPQAALRLRRLIGHRFDGRSDDRANRPVPCFAVIRGGEAPDELDQIDEDDPPLAPDAAPAGTPLTHGMLTFHDDQGLIIDPVAVACLHRDLMHAFPALLKNGAGTTGDLTSTTGGSIGAMCARGGTTPVIRLHVVDPFGGPWVDRTDRVGLRIGSSGDRLGAGPHTWSSDTLQATATDAADLRFGLAPEGILDDSAITRPGFPATVFPAGSPAPVLERQYLRAVAVHLGLHLLGNRRPDAPTDPIDGVPRADEASRLEPAPVIRDGDTVDVLTDGQATTGAITELGPLAGLMLAVSPTLAADTAFPPSRTQRWPAVPATTGTAQDLSGEQSGRARSEPTAAYAGDSADVVVTWPAGALPVEAHVRVFPRVDPGPATVPLAELDFARRGDGGATIVPSGATAVLLRDPFRAGTTPRPTSPTLRFDLLIATRGPAGVKSRLFGGLELSVVTGGVAPTVPPASNALSAVPLNQRGLCPAPLLGLPPTQPAAGSDPILAALGESAPREAPRFRTMARTESIAVRHDGGSPGAWTGVLTPGFLNGRSVRGDARIGNPGNNAGPEDHAPGLRLTGQLARDLARAALRRTHHLARRLPELDAGRWSDPASPGTGTIAGAVLQGVAEICDSPELSLAPESIVHSLPGTWAELVSALGSWLPSAVTSLVPTPSAGDRWVAEVKREAFAAKHGRRDAQWSWRWALSHARTLVYLETPLFGATSGGTADHEVDLVALLKDRLEAAPDLRVVLALPRRIPFGPGYESFAQRFHALRNTAVDQLIAQAEDRVVVYHPIGFPGRPEVIRGTVAVVDDVWALVGSSSLSRRGLTFDGSTDVVLFDRAHRDGAGIAIRDLRRRAMARTLSVAPPVGGETPSPTWVRTRDPRAAFSLITEIVGRGGDGLVEPLWRGLPVTELPALDRAIADPDGRGFSPILAGFADVLAGLGASRV